MLKVKFIWESFYEKTGFILYSFFYSLNFQTLLWCMNPPTISGEHRPLIFTMYSGHVCVNNYMLSFPVLMVVAGEH